MNRLAVVVFTVGSLSLPVDGWFGTDKVKHFFLGTFIQSAAFSGFRVVGLDRDASLGGASAVTASAVFAKEFRDRAAKGSPSVKDAVWGLAGAAAISPFLARTKP